MCVHFYCLLVDLVWKQARHPLSKRVHGDTGGPENEVRRYFVFDDFAILGAGTVDDVVVEYRFDTES
jgi:hypothetical protein